MFIDFSKIKIGDFGHFRAHGESFCKSFTSCAQLFSNQQAFITRKISMTNNKCSRVKSIVCIGDVVYMIT